MITVPPSLLAHPADLQRLAGELLALRFDRAKLTEALLRVQEAACEVAAPGPGPVLPTPAERAEIERKRAAERLARGEWRVSLD